MFSVVGGVTTFQFASMCCSLHGSYPFSLHWNRESSKRKNKSKFLVSKQVPDGYSVLTSTFRAFSNRSKCSFESSSFTFLQPLSRRNCFALSLWQVKQGRWPAASAVASSRKNSSVYDRGCMISRRMPWNSSSQMIQRLVSNERMILPSALCSRPRFPMRVPRS